MQADPDPPPAATDRMTAPRPSRPAIAGYGIPTDQTGLLPWSHVTARMTTALHYWIGTVSPDSRPHMTPMDGIWLDDRLYFGGGATTRWRRNLPANPAVCVHLDSSTEVVIVHGDAHEMRAPERALTLRLAAAAAQKYGAGAEPAAYEAGGVYVVRPRVVFAWTQFPADATRWHVPIAG